MELVVDRETLSVFNQTLVHRQLGSMDRLKGPMVCSEMNGHSSRGIFFNDNPLEDSFNVFTLQIILLILAYQIVYFLLRPLKQTKFICSVVVLTGRDIPFYSLNYKCCQIAYLVSNS